MTDRLRIGLVGAGPWAGRTHAPTIAAHPGTELAGVWARRPEAAAELVAAHGGEVFDDPDSLIAAVDAVAFAVPPSVQAPLAVAAARAGRHLILEKPVASSVADAERLADAAGDAGVSTIVMLALRFAPEVRTWLDEVRTTGGWQAGTGRWLAGSLLSGAYAASRWRHDEGSIADLGPHAVDLMDAALGEVTGVLAARRADPDVWHLILEHGEATSTVSLSAKLAVPATITTAEVYGRNGHSVFPGRTTSAGDAYTLLLDEFTELVRTTTHPCDVYRGLHLQRVLADAIAQA